MYQKYAKFKHFGFLLHQLHNFFYTRECSSLAWQKALPVRSSGCLYKYQRQIMDKVLSMFMTFRVGFSFTFRHLKPLLYGCLFAILI